MKAGFRQVYHDTKVAMCGHVRVLPPHECVASVVGRSNLFNFILATASKDDADEYIKVYYIIMTLRLTFDFCVELQNLKKRICLSLPSYSVQADQ